MIGIPSLSRSRFAAYSSACARLNFRCVMPAGGVRISLIGTGRTFEERRAGWCLGTCCFVIATFLSEPPNERAEFIARALKRLQPFRDLAVIDVREVNQ